MYNSHIGITRKVSEGIFGLSEAMAGKSKADAEQLARVKSLALGGERAAEIERILKEEGLLTAPHPELSDRVIRGMVARIRPPDASGAWSFRDAAALCAVDAGLVVDVAALVAERTEGRRWLTKWQAKEVLKLRQAMPDIPADWAYGLALSYLRLQPGGDTRHIDITLGMKPWLGDAQQSRWIRTLEAVYQNEKRWRRLLERLIVGELDRLDTPENTPESTPTATESTG